jgi:chaperonin GroES
MKINPTADHIVVRRLKADEKTPGGILIPDAAREKVNRGIVEGVGPGAFQSGRLIEPRVKKGDTVLFSEQFIGDVKIEGQEYVILIEGAILAVLEK